MTQAPYPRATPPVGVRRTTSHPAVRTLAIVALALAAVSTLLPILSAGVGFVLAATNSYGPGGTPVLLGLLSLLGVLTGIALFVLAIIIIVLGRGRARIGGIVIAAALVLSVVAGIVRSIVLAVTQRTTAIEGNFEDAIVVYQVVAFVGLGVSIVLGIAMIVGAVLAYRASSAERVAPSTPTAPPLRPTV